MANMRLLICRALFVLIAVLPLPAGAEGNAHQRNELLLGARPIQGPVLKPADFEGKTVIVTFFASWCPPCIHEFKVLGRVRSHYGTSDVTLIAVNVFEKVGADNEDRRLKRFLSRSHPGISVIEGDEAIREAFGNVSRIPTLVMHDRDGSESYRFVHERGAQIMSVDYETLAGALGKSGVAAPN